MIINQNIGERMLGIAKELTQPTQYAKLLQNIIDDAMEITNCDAATLYIMNQGKLSFMIMITKSKGYNNGGDGLPIAIKDEKGNTVYDSAGKPVLMPPVDLKSKSVCAYVARNKVVKNIPDVYNDAEFDWEGPKKYDAINNYHTQSELVVPLVNHEQKVIGVIQLINALDEKGNIVPFTDEESAVLESIASLAAVSLSNSNMIKQLQVLLESFVSSFTAAIDARTPYNANHTRHVATYCGLFCDFLEKKAQAGEIDFSLNQNQKDQLVMAASLHDVGKLIIPLEIMNKSDRLDFRLSEMKTRWKWLKTDMKVKLHSGMISEEEFERDLASYDAAIDFILECNSAPFLDPDTILKITKLNEINYETSDKEVIDFITDDEVHELKIPKGTLTAEERREIERHAEYTSHILEEIEFGEKYDNVRFIAGAHHELLNGTGYPNHLTAEDIPIEVRILTIMDVFDSLSSSDRPYRKQTDKGSAVKVLRAMVSEGKLDPKLVELAAEFFETQDVLS